MAKIYDIHEKIKETLLGTKKPNIVFDTEILKNCPDETKFLYPGKLYVFDYIRLEPPKKLYDQRPFVMSLGPKKDNNKFFYAINMHHIPYKIRLQIFEFLYDKFYNIIEKEILNNPNPKDAEKQKYIEYINTDLISNSPFNVNIKPCIKKYDIKLIRKCKLVNYNLIHYMLQSDDNYFENGSIQDAQKEFTENMMKSKTKK